MASPTKTEYTAVLLGNPGGGKSTLCNGILREIVFESGISIAFGKTQQTQQHQATLENDRILLLDTPGLADVVTEDQNLQEIQKAFETPGIYKLFFVIVLEAGRITSEDTDTIQVVLEALPPDINFGVLVNKVTPALMCEKSEISIHLSKSIGRNPTSIEFLPHEDQLEDEPNQLPSEEVLKPLKGAVISLPASLITEPIKLIGKKQLKEQLEQEKKRNEELKIRAETAESMEAQKEENERKIEELHKTTQQLQEAQKKPHGMAKVNREINRIGKQIKNFKIKF